MTLLSPRTLSFLFRRCVSTAPSSYVTKVRQFDMWKRHDDALVAHYDRGQFMLMLNRRVLMEKSDGVYNVKWLSHKQLTDALAEHSLSVSIDDSILIDAVDAKDDGSNVDFVPQLAVTVKTEADPNLIAQTIGGRLLDNRSAFLSTSWEGSAVIAKVQGLLNWARTYRHCPKCATELTWNKSHCTASCKSCERQFYPQTSPVAICFVRNVENTHGFLINLPRSRHATLYTCVAGFADVGESIEETARREVAEEAGLDVVDIKYMHLSHSWPFPQSSLMQAFIATADMNQSYSIDRHELNDGQWFTRSAIGDALDRIRADPRGKNSYPNVDGDLVFVPPANTMAHRMIEMWINHEIE